MFFGIENLESRKGETKRDLTLGYDNMCSINKNEKYFNLIEIELLLMENN